jgi:hypothetical protein
VFSNVTASSESRLTIQEIRRQTKIPTYSVSFPQKRISIGAGEWTAQTAPRKLDDTHE